MNTYKSRSRTKADHVIIHNTEALPKRFVNYIQYNVLISIGVTCYSLYKLYTYNAHVIVDIGIVCTKLKIIYTKFCMKLYDSFKLKDVLKYLTSIYIVVVYVH